MINRHSQQGLTTIGWIAVIGLFGLITVSGFKVLPMYIDYYSVRSVLDGLAKDDSVDVDSRSELWKSINRRLNINSVRTLTKKDFKFSRSDDITTITADYEVRKPYLGDLFIGAHFTYSVEIKR